MGSTMMIAESTAHSAVQWHTGKKIQRMGTKEDIEIMSRVGLTREADSRWFNQGKQHEIDISYPYEVCACIAGIHA